MMGLLFIILLFLMGIQIHPRTCTNIMHEYGYVYINKYIVIFFSFFKKIPLNTRFSVSHKDFILIIREY